MDGFEIIFTPSDHSFTGSPEFIRSLAASLGLEKFESLRLYREAPSSSELRPDAAFDREVILEAREVPVEDAIVLQRNDPGATAVMDFGFTEVLDALAAEAAATLEDWTPVEGRLYNGPWQHYEFNSGELLLESCCCLILGNSLGYPVDLDGYLQAFLEVPSVARFRQRLKELSGQPWHALIDLT